MTHKILDMKHYPEFPTYATQRDHFSVFTLSVLGVLLLYKNDKRVWGAAERKIFSYIFFVLNSGLMSFKLTYNLLNLLDFVYM